MSLVTFATLRQRVNYLVGDTSASTQAIIDSHINAAVLDIVNAYPFSWNLTKTTGSVSGSSPEYSLSLAADYNPRWHLEDARIVVAGAGGDHIFTEVPVTDRDAYDTGSYVWWPTYSTSTNLYAFNTKEPSGTVTYYYRFLPAALTAASDVCPVPDYEAVCYLAASKNWLTDERNQSLCQLYRQEAGTRIQSMWAADSAFGPTLSEGSVVDYNPGLIQR